MGRTEEKDLSWQLGQYENDGEGLRLLLQKTPILDVKDFYFPLFNSHITIKRTDSYRDYMYMTFIWKTN